MQAVDQNDHLPGCRVDQTNIRRIEPAARERADRHRLIFSERNDIQRFLAFARIFRRAVPDADIILTGEPFLVLRSQSDDRAALRADEIVSGDANGPAKPGGHADDLVGGMDRGRPPDLLYRRHLLDGCKHLQANHGRLEAEQAVEIVHHAGQIERLR